MKKLMTPIFLAVAMLFSLAAFAQDRNCAAMEVLDRQLEADPDMQQRLQEIEQFTQQYIEQGGIQTRNVVTIPVVVHVLYQNSTENISDAQVISQIDVLNDDFRRLNSDADNTWSQAADTEIEFCLASVDPNGNATNGILRVPTNVSAFGTNDAMKFSSSGGSDAWPAADYMNIWVCEIGGGILGYAQFPGGPAATDGIVVDYRYYGTTGTATAPFNLGRTGTHEVGHWLNLRHIWGDGPCGADDFVSDTPKAGGPNYGCPNNAKSCGTDDMYQNYMDYTDDVCMNIFTAGQSQRMNALFASGGVRASIANAASVKCDGSNPPASEICDNGVDDDGDGLVDCDDSDCDAASNCQSTTPEVCDNGVDDDGDGFVDCADGDCSGATACQPSGTCDDPTGLTTNVIKGGKEATLSWNAVPGAVSYDVILCSPSAPTNCSAPFTTTATTVNATGLTKNASYEWCVTANCGTSGTSGQVCQSFVATPGGRALANASGLMVYPNPAQNVVTIDLTQIESNLTNDFRLTTQSTTSDLVIEAVDITGRVLRRVVSEGEGILQMNVADFAEGLYLFRVYDETEGLKATRKVVIKR